MQHAVTVYNNQCYCMNFYSSLLSSAHQAFLAVDEYKLDLTKDEELQEQLGVCLSLL